MSKNTSTRYCTKLDFGVTYPFGHRTCNSGTFLFNIGSKCAHYWDVLRTICNRFKPVQLRAVLSSFSFPKSSNCNWRFVFLRFSSVQFSSCFFRLREPDFQTLGILIEPSLQNDLGLRGWYSSRPLHDQSRKRVYENLWMYYDSVLKGSCKF